MKRKKAPQRTPETSGQSEAHRALHRRDFLKLGVGAGIGLTVSPWGLPAAWGSVRGASMESSRRLVVLELTGGNDALNMLVPYGDDAYHRARPQLRFKKSQLHVVNDMYGYHPSMEALYRWHEEGALCVVEGVGYDNPDRSHFRSLDIWHSAHPEEDHPQTGWIGRAADDIQEPFALRIGSHDVPLLLRSRRSSTPTLVSMEDYEMSDRAHAIRSTQEKLLRQPSENPALAEVRRASLAALEDSDRFRGALQSRAGARYPDTELASQLRLCASLCAAGVAPPVMFLNQTGYDTHSRQAGAHDQLLGTLSNAIGAFFQDLQKRGSSNEVLVMVYSEFGRRVKENASAGTDHGAAAPVLLISPHIKPGFHGPRPSLTDLGDGDLKFHTDFRRVYATVLNSWLKVTGGGDARFAPLPVI